MNGAPETQHVQTLVIGGGQAGLAVGYHLARRRLPFLILDAHERIGDAWRKRWDSLRLFTPARYDGLPGMRFPASGGSFITKDQMADYLESYAARFALPVRTGARVERLSRTGEHFTVIAGGQRYEADQVVVAMSNNQKPRIPDFAPDLDPDVVQMHSSQYGNPTQLREGAVLIVGAGNSGADIAMEVVASHTTWLAGKSPGHVPFRIEPFFARNGLVRIVRFVGTHVLTRGTPIGRRVIPKMLGHGAPLVRIKPNDLIAAGVQRVPRVVGVDGGLPQLEDGQVLDVANVIWCTGYRAGFSWIDLPLFEHGELPRHQRGIVETEPGLYFVGLDFLYAATSDTVTGVGRDAKHVVKALASRVKTASPVPQIDSFRQGQTTPVR
jgi:putative flavoprotein involved in K+ transport